MKTVGPQLPLLSLTPGFSPVSPTRGLENRFNGLPPRPKPLKRLQLDALAYTALKPGVYETSAFFLTSLITS